MQTAIALSPLNTLVAKLQKKGHREFSMTQVGFTSGTGKHSPLDTLVAKLQKKGHREFSMTQVGFTSGTGKYYEPRDLSIVKAYHFEDMINPKESLDVYVMKDRNGIKGYSIDASSDYEINEQNLYHWFITKVPRNRAIN